MTPLIRSGIHTAGRSRCRAAADRSARDAARSDDHCPDAACRSTDARSSRARHTSTKPAVGRSGPGRRRRWPRQRGRTAAPHGARRAKGERLRHTVAGGHAENEQQGESRSHRHLLPTGPRITRRRGRSDHFYKRCIGGSCDTESRLCVRIFHPPPFVRRMFFTYRGGCRGAKLNCGCCHTYLDSDEILEHDRGRSGACSSQARWSTA